MSFISSIKMAQFDSENYPITVQGSNATLTNWVVVNKVFNNDDGGCGLNPLAVREASILGHLNFYGALCVPRFYDLGFNKSDDTYIMMSHEGLPVKETMSEMNTKNRISWMNKIIDDIIKSVIRVHITGVIHGNLTVDNLMIRDDLIRLVDFSSARFIGEKLDNDSSKSFNSLERLTETNPEFSIDWWTLGASIVNFCLGVKYVPIDPSDDWIEFRQILNRTYKFEEFVHLSASGQIHASVKIPKSFPANLREKLESMLELNPEDRFNNLQSYQDSMLLPIFGKSSLKLRDNNLKFASNLIEHSIKYMNNRNPLTYHYGVLIDLILRSFRSVPLDLFNFKIVDCVIALTSLIDSNLYRPKGKFKCNQSDVDACQVLILKAVNNRVFTLENVRLFESKNGELDFSKVDMNKNLEISKKIIETRESILVSSNAAINKFLSKLIK
jgi:serine/threonine protein kinase